MAEDHPERGGPDAPSDDRDERGNGAPPPPDGGRAYGGWQQPGRQQYGDGRYQGDGGRPSGEQKGWGPGRPENPFRGNSYPPAGRPQGPGYPAGSDSKAFCILSYIGILWLVGLLAARDDPKVRYHVNQGIILSVFEFAFGILFAFVKSLITIVFVRLFSASIILPQLGMTLNGMLSFVLWCLTAAFAVIGIVHAAQDRQEPLPVIGTLFTVIS